VEGVLLIEPQFHVLVGALVGYTQHLLAFHLFQVFLGGGQDGNELLHHFVGHGLLLGGALHNFDGQVGADGTELADSLIFVRTVGETLLVVGGGQVQGIGVGIVIVTNAGNGRLHHLIHSIILHYLFRFCN